MTRVVRIVLGLASAALLLLFVFPLWHVGLQAPQYPEGLGLHIFLNTVRGVQPHDLQNINGLNHYIGMREITADAIPELRYMPWIVGGLAVLGLLAAAVGRRGLAFLWGGLLLLLSAAGLYDFWRWEYAYGHELSPTAIIKVPGMSYQPPLIGSKQLLNFNATSLPDIGGWIAIVVACAACVLLVSLLRGAGHHHHGHGAPA